MVTASGQRVHTEASSVVFIHGSGRAGADCWPEQVAAFPNAVFLTMPGYGTETPQQTRIDEWVDRVLAVAGPIHVIASSYGGIAAILAAERAADRVRSLALLEPTAHSYARGLPVVESAIAKLEPIERLSSELDPAEYYVRFFTALTGSRPGTPTTPEELAAAERSHLLIAPWQFDLPIDVFRSTPTQVVTGNWNAEYEEIGAALVDLGARHTHLEGYGHRIQDHPMANSVMIDWIGRHSEV